MLVLIPFGPKFFMNLSSFFMYNLDVSYTFALRYRQSCIVLLPSINFVNYFLSYKTAWKIPFVKVQNLKISCNFQLLRSFISLKNEICFFLSIFKTNAPHQICLCFYTFRFKCILNERLKLLLRCHLNTSMTYIWSTAFLWDKTLCLNFSTSPMGMSSLLTSGSDQEDEWVRDWKTAQDSSDT